MNMVNPALFRFLEVEKRFLSKNKEVEKRFVKKKGRKELRVNALFVSFRTRKLKGFNYQITGQKKKNIALLLTCHCSRGYLAFFLQGSIPGRCVWETLFGRCQPLNEFQYLDALVSTVAMEDIRVYPKKYVIVLFQNILFFLDFLKYSNILVQLMVNNSKLCRPPV